MGNGETCPMSPVYLHLPGEAFSSVALGPLASEPLGWSLVKDSDSLWVRTRNLLLLLLLFLVGVMGLIASFKTIRRSPNPRDLSTGAVLDAGLFGSG